ncbi:MAG TPA: hypothetical protein DGG95_00070 [Cytophagales bacterium]|nr:hypothetical protein [Cytophagales bacterium]
MVLLHIEKNKLMKRNNTLTKALFILPAILFVSACGVGALDATATPVPTNTPVATNTPLPTYTPLPLPTETPNVAATQKYDDIFAQVQKFADEGLIPNTDGKYIELEDFNETFTSSVGIYRPYKTDLVLESFVFSGHVKWETAVTIPEISGCGILFAQQEDTSDYAVFLDKSRIYFSSSTPRFYSELGKTRGTGLLSFGNPAEADLSLVVHDNHAYVYVDNEFIGEYTLAQEKTLKGIFGYGIISRTNRDFGTRCEITNARIWDLNP